MEVCMMMTINRKMLALVGAAVLGTGLVACQRGGEDKSASSQDSSSMNQAPKQGYTGPGSPSMSPPPSSSTGSSTGSPAGTGSPPGDNPTGSPGSTNPSGSQMQPGSPNPQDQTQPDQTRQR
jgi:hypothetical protein